MSIDANITHELAHCFCSVRESLSTLTASADVMHRIGDIVLKLEKSTT